jgi:predicted AAA+ superfamily ATPase
MHISRDIETTIVKQLGSPDEQFILLAGARQTGKTHILEHLDLAGMDRLIINLWDETREIQALRSAQTLEQFENYLAAFYQFRPGQGRVLIIDEAQGSPYLGKFLMQMHRTWNKQRVILSGSILSNLFSGNVPMPTGRIVEFVLRPLNFREFLRFRKKEAYLELLPEPGQPLAVELHPLLLDEYYLYLTIGGMPGLVNSHRSGGNLLLLFESLINNYYRDADRYLADGELVIRTRTVQYGALLEHCLRAVGRLVSFPSTNSSILSTDSPSYRVILPKLLDALRNWHLLQILPYATAQHTSKPGYSSKKYLFDTGVMNFLLTRGMPVTATSESLIRAQLLENAVCQELIALAGSDQALTSYRSHNKLASELDFVMRDGRNVIPVEVKAGEHVTSKSLHQMLDFMQQQKVKLGIVIYTGIPQWRRIEDQEILFLPPYYLHRAVSQIDQLGR